MKGAVQPYQIIKKIHHYTSLHITVITTLYMYLLIFTCEYLMIIAYVHITSRTVNAVHLSITVGIGDRGWDTGVGRGDRVGVGIQELGGGTGLGLGYRSWEGRQELRVGEGPSTYCLVFDGWT